MDVEKTNKNHSYRPLYDKPHSGFRSTNESKFKQNYVLEDPKFSFVDAAKNDYREVSPIQDKVMGKQYMCKIIRVDFKTREKDLLKHLMPMMIRHKNIIQIHDAFILKEDKIVDKKFVVLIMESCHLNLDEFLTELHKTGKWDENFQLRKFIMQQLLEVFTFLHERNVPHLDIRPENILIDEKGIVKITNFGGYYEFDDKGFDTVNKGARMKHKIKHIFKRKVRDEEVNSIFFYKRKDIYNLGAILLVIDQYPKVKFTDKYLNFENMEFDEKKILKIVDEDVKDPYLRQILPDMLQEKPKNRHTLTQILHGWRDNDTTKMGKVQELYQEHIMKKKVQNNPVQGQYVESQTQKNQHPEQKYGLGV